VASAPKVNLLIYTMPKCFCWDGIARICTLALQGWKNTFKVSTSVLDSCGKEKTSKTLVPGLTRLFIVDCLPVSELAFSLNCSKNVEKL